MDSNTMRFIIMVFAIVLKIMNAINTSPARQMRNTKMLADSESVRTTLKATTTVSTL